VYGRRCETTVLNSGWLSDAIRCNSIRASITLVGNKCDRVDLREVTEEEAKRFVTQHDLAGYMETSAKTDVNVEDSFEATARHVLNRIRSGDLDHPAVSHSWQVDNATTRDCIRSSN
jgi:GTPase SAR1 family protein